VILFGASSMASSRVSILIPPLLAQYKAKCGNGSSSCAELMLIIFPGRPDYRRWRTTAGVTKNIPFKLTFSIFWLQQRGSLAELYSTLAFSSHWF